MTDRNRMRVACWLGALYPALMFLLAWYLPLKESGTIVTLAGTVFLSWLVYTLGTGLVMVLAGVLAIAVWEALDD